MVCYSCDISYFKNGRYAFVSGKAVPCKSSHLNCCPMAFLNRCHESSWHKERLLWEFLLGVLSKGRKQSHLGGFLWLFQGCCAHPQAA